MDNAMLFAEVDWEGFLKTLGGIVIGVVGACGVYKVRTSKASNQTTETVSAIGMANRDKAFEELRTNSQEQRRMLIDQRKEFIQRIDQLKVEYNQQVGQLKEEVAECRGEKDTQSAQIGRQSTEIAVLREQNKAFRRLLISKGVISPTDDDEIEKARG